MKTFIQRHGAAVIGFLSGFDRLRLRGTKRLIANVAGMDSFLRGRKILLKDFRNYAMSLTARIRRAVEQSSEAAGRAIEYLARSGQRKDAIARQRAAELNIREGLICVLSCVEPCWSFQIVRNPRTRHIDLRVHWTKCLHYYHYLMHPLLGLMHTRLQTWFPFTVHVCINGREWLARQMDAAGLGYVRRENCFVHLDDPPAAQRLMDRQLRTNWVALLNDLVPTFNPLDDAISSKNGPVPYYWSADESEWATDLLFRNPAALAALYPHLIHHATVHFGSREVMRFLGRSVPATHGNVRRNFNGEVTSDLRARPEGMRIKHRVNQNWIKMYDKQGSVLRIETVINNPRDWKVYRPKQGASNSGHKSWRPLRKGVADFHRRAQVSQAANERYLASLAAADAGRPFGKVMRPLCRPVVWQGRRARALNPLSQEDADLLQAVYRGEFTINGFRNRDLRALLFERTSDANTLRRQSAAVTRKIRLLRAHGLIRKIPKTHRYHLTAEGRRTIATLLAARAANADKLTAAA